MPAGIAVATASGIPFSGFFFYNGPYVRFIYLEMGATAAADPNLRYKSSNSPFSCNALIFLRFLKVLPASVVTLCMGFMVLFKVYSVALNTIKNM